MDTWHQMTSFHALNKCPHQPEPLESWLRRKIDDADWWDLVVGLIVGDI